MNSFHPIKAVHEAAVPRFFLRRLRRFGGAVFTVLALIYGQILAADRPNILWITSEDNGPYLGCYGDPQAQTPNLDRLASQGVRYRNAFANAPVCSTARTTLITGMYAPTLGAQHHRSSVRIPGDFQLYPEVLRDSGYYCTNNAKTDYNLANVRDIWDETSDTAHYRNRRPGDPFFAVFNIGTSHESQVAPETGKTSFRIPPEEIVLPPYHPDTPEIRRDWANYYDQITTMDAEVGRLLGELNEAGLADETIVFYYSDHGGALPRGKRNIHDSGTRVPLIIRFPEKWAHLAPAGAGAWVDQPVGFVDFPATVLSLCGAEIPPYYQGRAFLGQFMTTPREHVFLYRGRMDERYDMVRAVRDHEVRYVRNFSPHLPWGQHYSYPFEVLPSMGSWFAEFEHGRCDPIQSRYWQLKPAEEFYHVPSDPHEIQNLVGNARFADRLEGMRRALRDEIVASRDAGFIPEAMAHRLAGGKTIYEYAQSSAYPIERILDLAETATSGNPDFLSVLRDALADPHPVLRYWGALGCLILQDKAAPAESQLRSLLEDDWPDVRMAAAQALGHFGESGTAIAVLAEELGNDAPYVRLTALNALEYMWKAGHAPLPQLQRLVEHLELEEPDFRIPHYLLSAD